MPAGAGAGLELPVLSSTPEPVDPVQLAPLESQGAVPAAPLADVGGTSRRIQDVLDLEPAVPPEVTAPQSMAAHGAVQPDTATDHRSAVPETHLISGRFSRRELRGAPRTDTSGRFSRVKPDVHKAVELQRIVSVRVLSLAEEGWPGDDVAAALAGSDLVHGRYGVFHRLHQDGRTIFHVASLKEPGSFDPAIMSGQNFHGLSIFAILPGPMPPLETLETMLGGASQIAVDLAGTVQDEKGQPLTPAKADQLRDDVRNFQARLREAASR